VTPLITRPFVRGFHVLLWGGAAIALAAAIGFGVELARFGRSEATAAQEAERTVRGRVASITEATGRAAETAATRAQLPGPDDTGQDAIRRLFDVAAGARGDTPERDAVAVTIYDAAGAPLAWSGRASDLPPERVRAGPSVFVISSPLGLRVVAVRPIAATAANAATGSAVAEHALAPAPLDTSLSSQPQYTVETPVGPVSLTPDINPRGASAGDYVFSIESGNRVPLVQGRISASDLAAARADWRRGVYVTLLALSGAVLLLFTGPVLDRRAASRSTGVEFALTAAAAAIIVAAGVVFWIAQDILSSPEWRRPIVLLIVGGTAAGVAVAIVSGAVRLRLALRTRRRSVGAEPFLFVAAQLAAGVLLAVALAWMERLLGRAVDPQAIDLRHFSLHPWSGPRLMSLAGILLGHAAALWGGAIACVVAISRWRLPRRLSVWHVAAFALWVGPVVALGVWAPVHGWALPGAALILGACAIGITALMAPRLTVWYRQTTAVSRILALFLAFLLPALLIYPSVAYFVDRSTRRIVESRYAPETVERPARLLARLQEALAEIDAQPFPAAAIDAGPGAVPRTDPAFAIWNKTALARNRLTSDVELFDPDDDLVSRFALNFPEYTGAALKPQGRLPCQWDIFSEAQPFGAEERRMLHAQRSVCAPDGSVLGAIIVHVVFDYRTLPFITSQSPYYEALRGTGGALSIEEQPAGDVDVVVYGWSLRPIYTSGGLAWPLDDVTFDRIYRSRTPFWTSLEKDGTRFNVYISNDRGGIYALGYPVPDLFEHLVRLAELTTLAAAGYVLTLVLGSLFARVSRGQPRSGRALLREIRASFYRKLFLAFVLASIVPVLILALVIRTYFANLLYEGIADEAARTAAVAQRVIGESDALLRRGAESFAPFGDDVMVWISQVINQDVNIFYGPELFATSERDLFASGLLPTRVPEDVYRAIVLQRLASFVSEDRIGNVPYLLASTHVRTGSRDAILTVPLALRQREVEREIDELDRGVHLAALCFILLGAAIGLSMAERIADPVRRLTRATGRIAGGDFDARIAVRSSDELRRLVDAFNSMAAELKAQRAQLERTHRIEAWAEMARQVAHEIKNPLTPIQLSAEHLRRVHEDRGTPMSPVLENCVDTILGQVRLLRQISAEFSSFASSPTARPAPADPVALVRDVVEPYRHGLVGRIDVRNDVAPPLPLVFVDRTLVSRALANIVENALHAMPGRGSLSVTARESDASVVIEVTDTGVGMDREALARVFEPYFSTKTTGTGLGLPIARRNIELSGGAIQVESEKGRGTRVTISLPVAAAPSPATSPEQPPAGGASG
jgi:signal transduction histidine kinase